jgi:hypothetical protein
MRRGSRYASFATVVLLALSVSACATFATRQTKLQAVKTVGVISAVGDEISFARTGLTGLAGLNNASQRFPVSSWGLDDLNGSVAARARRLCRHHQGKGEFRWRRPKDRRHRLHHLRHAARVLQPDLCPLRNQKGPSRLVDESFSPGAGGDAARNENLHGAIKDLVMRSLAATLSDMLLAEKG